MMSEGYQIEFPRSSTFQQKLRELKSDFETLTQQTEKMHNVIGLCVQALQDIRPQHIDDALAACEMDEEGDVEALFRRTSNLTPHIRELLDNIKLHLIANHQRSYSRRDITTGIISVAYGLNSEQKQYILSEYR